MVEVHSGTKARLRDTLTATSRRTRRVVVTGSESTGKTTLARQLARFLGTDWTPEYSREFAESARRSLTAGDVESIARGQKQREDERLAAIDARGPNGILICDTDLLSTTVYAEHYYGNCPSWIMDASRRRLADLYLLTDPDLPWESDGVRDMPNARRAIHRRFVQRLADFDANVLLVWGSGDQRFQNALASVRGWRAALAKK
jgi:NadR type nicotinamide-nucleotide adenylyltransferase